MNYLDANTDARLQKALKTFGASVSECRADNGALPWSPMLPYVYKRYGESARRYFYIGRDTYCWDLGGGTGFGDFFERYDAGDMVGYLRKNCTALTTQKRVNEWAGCTGSFWYIVNMLQLRLRTGKMPDMSNLVSSDLDILDEIGYANLNAVELPETLKKQECWEDIDVDKYWTIKKAAENSLDRYELIHDVFAPSASIITTWSGNEDMYFRGLEYKKITDEKNGRLKIAVYSIEKDGHKSIVVWTYHPSYLPRIGVACEDFVERIASVVEKHIEN